MKVIINKILPFGKKYYAINIFGVLFAKGECDKYTINHEKIHTAQMKELLVIGFYLAYLLEWLVRLIQYGSPFKAYLNISFEREAYTHDRDLEYLKRRKHYAFISMLKVRSSKS